MPTPTSWGHEAQWYHAHLSTDADTFHAKVVLPNLLRLLNIQPNEHLLDIACGTGFFSRAFFVNGAKVTGIDIAPELIAIAKKESSPKINYLVASADNLKEVKNGTIDIAVIIFALQNIKDVSATLAEIARVLKPNGRVAIVLNHPAFRIPRASSSEWDEDTHTQYRRVDRYLSEITVPIDMHPGQKKKSDTVSFHRSLQYFFKTFRANGFAVTQLEEWISHRKNTPGPRYAALEQARKEFPLFLFLELRQVK